jgi:hypothetical protein
MAKTNPYSDMTERIESLEKAINGLAPRKLKKARENLSREQLRRHFRNQLLKKK